MSSPSKPVSSRELAERAGGHALARLQRSGHALPEPGEDAPGRAAHQQDLRLIDVPGALRRPGRPTRRRGPVGTGSCGRLDPVQLLEMHQVVDAGEEQPLAAAQPADERMDQRARLLLVTERSSERNARRSVGSGRSSVTGSPVGVRRAGDARHDRRRIGRPAVTGRQRRGEGQAGPTLGRVPDAWATFQSPSPPGSASAASGSASTRRSAHRPGRRAGRPGARPCRRRSAGGPRGGPRGPGPPRSRATPRPCPGHRPRARRPRSSSCGQRSGRDRVIGGRWPSPPTPAAGAAATSRRSRRAGRARASTIARRQPAASTGSISPISRIGREVSRNPTPAGRGQRRARRPGRRQLRHGGRELRRVGDDR